MNLDEIAYNFKKLPTFKLAELVRNPQGLSLDVIPVLQRELMTRGEHDDALKLSDYLVSQQKPSLNHEELQQEIKDRLAAGESMEDISLKFKENGIDVFNELTKESHIQKNTFDYILSMREKGVPEEEIEQKLQIDLSLSEAEVDIVKQKLKSRGRMNLIAGWCTTAITAILILVSLGIGRGPGVGAIVLLGIGIWRIIEGNRMLNSSRETNS